MIKMLAGYVGILDTSYISLVGASVYFNVLDTLCHNHSQAFQGGEIFPHACTADRWWQCYNLCA